MLPMQKNNSDIRIDRLRPQTPEIEICARWRIDAFSDVLGNTYAQEEQRLNDFVSGGPDQVGFVAYVGNLPAGTCLLAPKEIEPCHPLTPWLAGLFVAAEFRRRGVAEALIRAIENAAKEQGHDFIYLYADEKEVPFYAKRGWTVAEQFEWLGAPTTLMSKVLST